MERTLNTRAARAAREEAELEAELAKQNNSNGNDEELSKEEKTWKKRHSDLRSHSDRQINSLKEEINTLKIQLKDAAQKQIKFPKTEEEVSEWIKKYPDVAAIVKTIAMTEVQEARKDFEARDAQLQDRAYQVEFDKCVNKILKAHSDFFDIKDTDEFLDWLEHQPKYVRSVFDSEEEIPYEDLDDAADTAIMALKMFKVETKKDDRREKVPDNRREAARGVETRNRVVPSADGNRDSNLIYESDLMKMRNRDFTDEFEEKLNAAMREGRFVQDVTGAAR